MARLVWANDDKDNTIKLYHYHNNHLGTPQELTDQNGEVIWLSYDMAWGGQFDGYYKPQQVGSYPISENELQPIKFQGQFYDVETGLHYNRFMHQWQHTKILEYKATHGGKRPPLNKNDYSETRFDGTTSHYRYNGESPKSLMPKATEPPLTMTKPTKALPNTPKTPPTYTIQTAVMNILFTTNSTVY